MVQQQDPLAAATQTSQAPKLDWSPWALLQEAEGQPPSSYPRRLLLLHNCVTCTGITRGCFFIMLWFYSQLTPWGSVIYLIIKTPFL